MRSDHFTPPLISPPACDKDFPQPFNIQVAKMRSRNNRQFIFVNPSIHPAI
jgi:hypothetical protein